MSRTSNIHGLADLGGKKIALVTGTSNERAVSNIVRQLSIIVTLVPVKDRDEGVAALESGKVDAFASDKLLLAGAKFKDEEAFAILPDDLSIEQYAIVLPRGDWALRLGGQYRARTDFPQRADQRTVRTMVLWGASRLAAGGGLRVGAYRRLTHGCGFRGICATRRRPRPAFA